MKSLICTISFICITFLLTSCGEKLSKEEKAKQDAYYEFDKQFCSMSSGKKKRALLEKAAYYKHPAAMVLLANIYIDEYPDDEVRMKKALSMLEELAIKDINIKFSLAMLYLEGKGNIPVDKEKGYLLLTEVVKTGHKVAKKYLEITSHLPNRDLLVYKDLIERKHKSLISKLEKVVNEKLELQKAVFSVKGIRENSDIFGIHYSFKETESNYLKSFDFEKIEYANEYVFDSDSNGWVTTLRTFKMNFEDIPDIEGVVYTKKKKNMVFDIYIDLNVLNKDIPTDKQIKYKHLPRIIESKNSS